jgi:hypothetical protein
MEIPEIPANSHVATDSHTYEVIIRRPDYPRLAYL